MSSEITFHRVERVGRAEPAFIAALSDTDALSPTAFPNPEQLGDYSRHAINCFGNPQRCAVRYAGLRFGKRAGPAGRPAHRGIQVATGTAIAHSPMATRRKVRFADSSGRACWSAQLSQKMKSFGCQSCW